MAIAPRLILLALMAASTAQAQTSAYLAMIPYTTLQGDTYIKIASSYFENPADWPKLLKANPIKVDRHLQPGTILQLPVDLLKRTPLTAKVIAISGQVTSDNKPLEMGSELHEGSRIKSFANSFLTLELSDHSRIAIPSNSEVQLERLRQYAGTAINDTRIVVQKGKLETQVSPQKGVSRFEVQSPVAVAGVRGTVFRVGVSEDGKSSTGEVLQGKIGLSDKGGNGEVDLPEKFGAVAKAGQPVGGPVALLPPPSLDADNQLQDEPALHFSWQATAPADKPVRAYHAQIAKDAAFTQVIHENLQYTQGSTKNSINEYAPKQDDFQLGTGEYYLKLTAIDQNGLEGLPVVQRFSRHLIIPGVNLVSPLDNAASNDGKFSWTGQFPVRHPAIRYHFQLGFDSRFSSPVKYYQYTDQTELTLPALSAGQYYWRVAPVLRRADGSEEIGSYSAIRQVTISNSAR